MFWINAIAFILADIPILFFAIYYFFWSREFYVYNSVLTAAERTEKHDLRKSAMVWRAVVEGGLFLSQLVWVYVMQNFGQSKEKTVNTMPEVEVKRVTAKDVERISSFDATSSMMSTTKY
jgi:hypothetical protein